MSTCACPRRDALDCMQFRYGLDMKIIFGERLTEDEETERCSCACHDLDEEDGSPDNPSDWS